MKRREFLLLTAGFAGCTSVRESGNEALPQTRAVDAGPATAYQRDGVYSTFVTSGFFLVRQEGRLVALSSICTHRKCKLEAEADRSFYCPCHGSTFDPSGKVKDGPATKDLPILVSVTNSAGHLIVSAPMA